LSFLEITERYLAAFFLFHGKGDPMKFLIPTEPDDVHAILVKLALEKMEHQVTLMFTADQPTRLKNSVYIDADRYRWKSEDKYETVVENDYDVVWWRRARKPYLPKEMVHPDDYKFVSRENTLFYESFTHTIAPYAWWVNTKESANRANFKLLQLKIAQECGLQIPVTLCSNDPKEIRYFLLNHEAGGVVYKPLCPNYWFEEDSIRIAYTSRVGFIDLPTNQSLQRAPGIFQKEVKKKYELRVTCFGRHIVAAKLDSQTHQDGQVDWRAIRKGKLSIEPYDLPEQLQEKIRTFMHRLGIVFGSFDFIVTLDDEYIFLEVNEQGQFLWIEEYNPAFNMLDLFVHFLINQSIGKSKEMAPVEHTIAQYREDMALIFDENRKRHVDLNGVPTQ
jgi:glutathione synthase/RimK-type ligase-like ATP-grasp enzyme